MYLLKNTVKTFCGQKNIKTIIHINIIFFVFFMISDSIDVYVPLALKTLSSIEGLALGTFQSITFIIRMLAILFISKLCFKNKKSVLLIATASNILLLITFQIRNTPVLFFIVFGLLVVTRSIVNIVMNPTIARLCSKETLGVTFGVRDVFLSLGSFVGLIVSGVLAKTNNPMLFLLFIILCLILLFVLLIKLKADNVLTDFKEDEKESVIKKPKEKIPVKINYIIFCCVCIFLSMGTSFQLFMPNIGSSFGINDSNIFYFFSASTIITAALSFLGGIIIDRTDKKMLFFIYITICLASVLLLIPKTEVLFIVSLVVIGIRGVLDNIEQAYFFDYFSDEANDFLWSVHSSLQMGLGFVLPIFAGFMYDKNLMFLIAFCLLTIAISYVFCFALHKIKKRT